MVYSADPIFDIPLRHPPLEVHKVEFDGEHYRSNQGTFQHHRTLTTTTNVIKCYQGRKKLRELQEELRRLISVHHANLLRIFAVKMTLKPNIGSPPMLCILVERNPALSLAELLENCETIPITKSLVSS